MIRLAIEKDDAAMLAIYTPYVNQTAITFAYTPPTLTEFSLLIQDIRLVYPILVYEEHDQILGYAYAHRLFEKQAYQWDVEVSIYCDEQAKGKGIGTKLFSCLLELLKLQAITNVYSLITYPNEASVALHEKMGFVQSGVYHQSGYKLGAWHDVMVYECMLQKPIPPIAFQDMSMLSTVDIDLILKKYQEE